MIIDYKAHKSGSIEYGVIYVNILGIVTPM